MSITMLYRKRDTINAEAFNLPLDTIIVADDDIGGAMAEGWLDALSAIASLDVKVAPEPGPYDSFLDASVAEITPLLDDMTADELTQLLAAEQGGKTRAGLVTAINKAIAAKTKD